MTQYDGFATIDCNARQLSSAVDVPSTTRFAGGTENRHLLIESTRWPIVKHRLAIGNIAARLPAVRSKNPNHSVLNRPIIKPHLLVEQLSHIESMTEAYEIDVVSRPEFTLDRIVYISDALFTDTKITCDFSNFVTI